MKKLTAFLMAGALCLFFSGIAMAQSDGVIGTISEIDATSEITGLTLDADGVDVIIGTVTVSNNYQNAFDLKLAFTNDGVFKRTSAAGGDLATATGVGAEVPISSFKLLPEGTGTLGTGLTAPSGTFTLTEDAGADYYTWDTASTQLTATVDYKMDIKCSWSANSEDLQGTYTETVTATITVGDGV